MSNKLKKSVTEEYLDYYNHYVKKFGKSKTLILMQVGSFYEAYATTTDGPDLKVLEELTDASVAHKGKNKDIINIQNPLMWGFPMVASLKFIGLLIGAGYHLVMIDQVSPKPNIRREVVAIHSPATYLELTHNPTSNFIISLYIDEMIQKNGQYVACIGMCAIDASTGHVLIHESHSHINDDKLALDETVRFINSLSPKEIIIFVDQTHILTPEYLTEYLNLEGRYFQFKKITKEHQKITYQKKILETVYPQNRMESISIIDALNISSTIYARHSLVNLLIYISDHFTNIISGCHVPEFYLSDEQMTLGNDAINQLHIVNDANSTNNKGTTKYQCLMDCINRASTGMGRRFIKMKLVSPHTQPTVLNKIYTIVDMIRQSDVQSDLHTFLKSIHDIERMYRKLSIGVLHPMDMVNLMTSYQTIYQLFTFIKKSCLVKYIKTSKLRTEIKKLNILLEKSINPDKAKLFIISNIRENIFNHGMYPDLDALQAQIGASEETMDELLHYLDKMIDDKTNGVKVILKTNNRDGYYYQITNKRYKILAKKFETMRHIKLSEKTINVSDFQVSENKNIIKLTLPFLKNQTTDIDQITDKIKSMTYKYYVEFIQSVVRSFGSIMLLTINTVTQIDYYTTIARVAVEYNYVRPIIDDQQCGRSYIVASDLRHPLIERIIDHEYIPQSIDIGRDLKGMMIYGLNSAGKSVLMKAIGISIIMAQAGFFVPASQYTYYPYKALYTRITGNDNMFKGLSSYSLEIVELNNILKRSNDSTLVIGDEICRGTEHISGNAIVAATLLKLSELQSTFVFATHLHELMDLKEIKEKKDIRAYHLSVHHDATTDRLIYNRNLVEGTGDRLYGITFAKYIIKDTDFIAKALEIKNILLNMDSSSSVVSIKKSRYNARLYMDRCTVCGKNNVSLETHHIEPQKDCVGGFLGTRPHIEMNHLSNLKVLCQTCHDAVHA